MAWISGLRAGSTPGEAEEVAREGIERRAYPLEFKDIFYSAHKVTPKLDPPMARLSADAHGRYALCFEIHPGEDLHDGVSFEMSLDRVGQHARANMLYDPSHLVLQAMDYLDTIDIYHERIKMFHAELRPSGPSRVYGGYQPWIDRAGRFRSLGDGQIDFSAIFSKLTQYGFDGRAVLEWECCLKHPEVGAA
jgi:sugar phosphate isomerase/epimerase